MKLRFKIQPYQTEAVAAICDVFEGQPREGLSLYRRDIGNVVLSEQTDLGQGFTYMDTTLYDDTGYRNEEIALSDVDLLDNLHHVESREAIEEAPSLSAALGRCQLDVEMETGTGKTYVYTKTIFELNRRYGWSKFIIVVPSIAIREGVKKSLDITADHFYEQYKKKAKVFVYDSDRLSEIDSFASSPDIYIMIINTQAFAASFDESKKEAGRKGNKAARIIYSERDDFGSRKPIEVIAAMRPILILDEPQKMGDKHSVTQKALRQFHPLFSLYFSATHREKHNLVYVLDALDAYNHRLVKRIEVKGFELKNLSGTNSYLYFSEVVLDPKKPPRARIEYEVRQKSGVVRKTRLCAVDDDLYDLSGGLSEYRHFRISDIDGARGTVSFTNGVTLTAGEASGDVSEAYLRRIQIRETIRSHLDKEERLFSRGIKVLSLFFIDKVEHYRTYDADGQPQKGEFAKVFEEEYLHELNERLGLFSQETPYGRYLKSVSRDLSEVHDGYFSIDKKGRMVDSKEKRGQDGSDDVTAYDKILRNKERLLSFEEPLRFIFSHSALREGWDNPNIFQICTLKRSGKDKKSEETTKRQEVGRGLRLCVNQDGVRQDASVLEDEVQQVNTLTVIASEGYDTFVAALQTDMEKDLYHRVEKAEASYFEGKHVTDGQGKDVTISHDMARMMYNYLLRNGYVDDDARLTDAFKNASAEDALAPLPAPLLPISEGLRKLTAGIYDKSQLEGMTQNGRDTSIRENGPNKNFDKEEFQALWKEINHKYAYTVHFDSAELIRDAVDRINKDLSVGTLKYVLTRGYQKTGITRETIENKEAFTDDIRTHTEHLEATERGPMRYDLVGDVARGAVITRRTAAEILSQILPEKRALFCQNPEVFIQKTAELILEAKSSLIVEHIEYHQLDQTYDSSIFTTTIMPAALKHAYQAKKSVTDYVVYDSAGGKQPVEKQFAEALDADDKVCVYAKLPKGFAIPTPMGNYNPDWAIAFKKGSVKHIFFIAETKGSMSSMELRPIESAKIACADKLFNHLSTSQVRYHKVTSYQNLLDIMRTMK